MNLKRSLLAASLLIIITFSAKAQNTFPSSGSAGIGTATPNASALLDMESTAKGLLIPQMTLVQRNAIATPATGLFDLPNQHHTRLLLLQRHRLGSCFTMGKQWQ